MNEEDEPYRYWKGMPIEDYRKTVDYWRNLFRVTEFENLDNVFIRFYEAWGIQINGLHISDNGVPLRPPLTKYRDEILRDRILERKPPTADMLIVAFWDARFAFNMGFDGYDITGIEPYRRAVMVANRSKDELFLEHRKRFKFNYGFAEFLEDYGQYDVIVNFCLEHVRDPRHVIEEALRHLKPDGCAYFTPPIKHGCGSPEHLHWFMSEDDLNALVPDGYKTHITRELFTRKTKRQNVFIMEVSKC